MIGLIGYAFATYGPYLLNGVFAYGEVPRPGPAVNIAFTAVWIGTVAIMAYGIYTLHLFMSREKRAELHRLDNEARKALDDPWEIDELHAVDPPSSFENNRERVQHVVATKEYPATFTMWTQLLVGVMVPKALQLVLAAV